MKVCQRDMERSILGVNKTDLIRNIRLRSKTRIADVGKNLRAKLGLGWTYLLYAPREEGTIATLWVSQHDRRRRGRSNCRR